MQLCSEYMSYRAPHELNGAHWATECCLPLPIEVITAKDAVKLCTATTVGSAVDGTWTWKVENHKETLFRQFQLTFPSKHSDIYMIIYVQCKRIAWLTTERHFDLKGTVSPLIPLKLHLKWSLCGHISTHTHTQRDAHTYTLHWVRITVLWHLEWTNKETGTCAAWYISGMTPLCGDELCSHRCLAVMATLTEDKAPRTHRAAGDIWGWHVGYHWHANTASPAHSSHEPQSSRKIGRQADEERWDIYLWKGPAVEKVWDKTRMSDCTDNNKTHHGFLVIFHLLVTWTLPASFPDT